jgi:predicted permease
MGSLLNDLKFGARTLLKRPGSTFIAVIAFALGIGLCTTMFSINYGVYFRGIGVPEANKLVLVFRANPEEDIDRMSVPQHDFYDWKEQQQSFEGIAGYSTGTVNLSGTEGPERFNGGFVTANMFDVLRVRAELGSTFREGDDAAGAPLTVLLGYDAWLRRYDADPDIVGKIVKVNGEQGTIIGVMPDGFMFPEEEQLWIPRRDERPANPERGTGNWVQVVGRLKAGTTVEQAELDMQLVAQRLAQEYPESNEGVTTVFSDFIEASIGNEADPVFVAMQVATIFVLLIACANVANLLLARAALRTKEAAVRSALGASRWRVSFPFFSEALVLSVVGAILGVGIAYVGITLFDRATTGIGKPYFMQFAIDLPVLGFVLAVTALTALISGAAPSFQIARADVNSILKDEGRGSSSFKAGKISKMLVIGEVAMSCALLVGAGLMTKSITKLSNYEFPFATEGLFTARVGLFEADFPTPADRTRFFTDLKEQLAALPRAQSVAITDNLPSSGSGNNRFAIEGETYETDQDYPRARSAVISTDFFETFDVELVRGRNFTLQDNADAMEVILVNQRFVERFFSGSDPIGRRIREGTSESDANWMTIVGVVPNMKMEGVDNQGADGAGYYVPLPQRDRRFMSIAIQVAGGAPLSIAPEVRQAVRAVDPDTPIYWIRDMPEVIRQETWFYTVFGSLFIVFGAAALFMASVGLYGVLAFSVSRRIQEMGIRMALGANAKDVLRMVLREGATQLGIGLGIGLLLAFGVSNVVGLVMFEVEPRDPTVFGAIVVVIGLVGVIASLVPARRATRIDPMVALRYD